jgi:hypothetical protein
MSVAHLDADQLELFEFGVIKLQASIRRYIVRAKIIRQINQRWEKILDPRRQRYYYYDKVYDLSYWSKPKLLLDRDLDEVSPTYSDEDAATKIQTRIRMKLAQIRVRMMYQSTVIQAVDESSGGKYYYNPNTYATMWELPAFMNGRLDYERKPKIVKKKPEDGESATGEASTKDGEGEEEEEDDDDDESEDGSELSEDSEAKRERKRLGRKFPRSKIQLAMDNAVDDIPEALVIDLSDCGATRISTRLYDCIEVRELYLSKNKLRKILPEVQYLTNLVILDVSFNQLKTVPSEIEELTMLEEFRASHNRIMNYPGAFYKLCKPSFLLCCSLLCLCPK